jgi:hypothetical protein
MRGVNVSDKLDKATQDWIAKNESLFDEGEALLKNASNEALDYVGDAIEHMNDRAWRKMTMETQMIEIGIGSALAESLVPIIYKDMEKTLHKKLKISKETAQALRHIYIGRVIKNIRKALNERADK